jgi:hypothetical protein
VKIGTAVFVIGAGAFVYGLAMLADWRSVGTQCAYAVIRRTNWLYRRKLEPNERLVARLSRFGSALAIVIGIGWMVAGAGLTAGWLK